MLFVVDGPLKAYEHDLLAALAKMEKRIVVCLNKEDWYDDRQRDELLGQIVEQVAPMVKAADVVAVRSRPVSRRRVHVLRRRLAKKKSRSPIEPPTSARSPAA